MGKLHPHSLWQLPITVPVQDSVCFSPFFLPEKPIACRRMFSTQLLHYMTSVKYSRVQSTGMYSNSFKALEVMSFFIDISWSPELLQINIGITVLLLYGTLVI